MNRRTFLSLSSAGVAAAGSAFAAPASAGPPSKRERMFQWLAGKTQPDYTPAAFFLHFGDGYKAGSAAARRHLEFFRYTDMDFVKIQFEQTYQRQEFLRKPSDWSKLQVSKLDFYEPLLESVRELVQAGKKNSLILMTLYSPFMSAGQCATQPVLLRHLEENPEAVKKGLEILTESQMIFVRACIQAGVDGFYTSTQGSEAKRFSSPEIFTKYVKPFDLVAMKEAATACPFNILHVCDYVAPYASYDAVYDYPGHVINCNTRLIDRQVLAHEIAKLFKRPFMGGMDRHGIIATGTPAQVEDEIKSVVGNSPRQMILGADCTVEADTNWDRLRHAIAVAHRVAA